MHHQVTELVGHFHAQLGRVARALDDENHRPCSVAKRERVNLVVLSRYRMDQHPATFEQPREIIDGRKTKPPSASQLHGALFDARRRSLTTRYRRETRAWKTNVTGEKIEHIAEESG